MSGRVKDEPAREMFGLDISSVFIQMSGFWSQRIDCQSFKETKRKKEKRTTRVSFESKSNTIKETHCSHYLYDYPQWSISLK